MRFASVLFDCSDAFFMAPKGKGLSILNRGCRYWGGEDKLSKTSILCPDSSVGMFSNPCCNGWLAARVGGPESYPAV